MQAVADELDLVHYERMGLIEQESPRVGHGGIEGGVVVERCLPSRRAISAAPTPCVDMASRRARSSKLTRCDILENLHRFGC